MKKYKAERPEAFLNPDFLEWVIRTEMKYIIEDGDEDDFLSPEPEVVDAAHTILNYYSVEA